MSSVVTAPGGASSRPSRTTLSALVEGHRPGRDFVAGAVIATAFCLIAFLASGGSDLAPNTWVQTALVLLGAAAAIAVLVAGAQGRAWGGATLAWFAALAALTYASIAWSVQPANSWLEANRTLSYLGAFGAALALARLSPGRWRALIGGVATATTVVCGYALLVKVFPATFDATDFLARLQAPFDYWNALGLMGALGIVPCLWAGAHPEGSRVLRALASPALAILLSALLLAYSRGALLVAAIGLAVWFAVAPLRLRSALILAAGAVGGGVIAAWGLSAHGTSTNGVSLVSRTAAGHTFGIVILVVLVLSTGAGLAAATALDRVKLSARWRRRVGMALLGAVALLPFAGLAALAASSRGFTGEVSHIWNNLTSTNGGNVGNTPSRLVATSNSRPRYWNEAIKVGEHHLLAGVGAAGFATAQPGAATPIWNPQSTFVQHAHGYLAETFADFGLIGLAITLALLVAWVLASGRSFEFSWPSGGGTRAPPSAEWTGSLALLAVVVTFGVHSLIDWTWFIPGTAVPALACAGWLAGRGPMSEVVGRVARMRRLSGAPGAVAAVAAVVVIALAATWVIVQPLRSFDAYWAAITAADHGRASTALTEARTAAVEDPVSIDPLFLLSQIYSGLGDRAAARSELVQAIARQPANPETWQELGCFDYVHHDQRVWQEFLHLVRLQPDATEAQTNPVAYCSALFR